MQRVNATISSRSGTIPDGQIVSDVMNRMGYQQGPYDPAVVLDETTRIVPLFAGIRWDNITENGKQWPVREDGSETPILHQNKFRNANGRGQFLFDEYQPSPELARTGEQFPYILTTGRILEHYNCGSMTRRTPNVKMVDHDKLLMNPMDAKKEGIVDQGRIEISSANGTTHLTVEVTKDVKPGILFTTFHFPEIAINHLTSDVYEQVAMTPEFKIVAVSVKSC